MARTRGSVGAETEKAIRKAAIELTAKHGFEAMTLRDLADHVGLQPGSIYRYIATKDQLLADIMAEHMEALLAAWRKADDPTAGPLARLENFVDFHIRYHFARQKEVLIANLELRSLTPDSRRATVALRKAYENELRRILDAGIAKQIFPPVDSGIATYAIISMLTGVCFWYSPKGRLAPDEIIAIHKRLVLGSLHGAPRGEAKVVALAGRRKLT
ncbi:MAG: TetR/AcrR family transcriptional regulator [Parvibaculaceae bacterium]